MIAGLPMVGGLLLPGVASEVVPGSDVAPDGFGAVLAAAMGPGVTPDTAGDARAVPDADEEDASVALVPVVAVLPDPVMVPVPVAVQPGDAAVPDLAGQGDAVVRARPDRGEAAALLRAGMVAASLPVPVAPRGTVPAAAPSGLVTEAPEVGLRAVVPALTPIFVQDRAPVPVPAVVAASPPPLSASVAAVPAPAVAVVAPLAEAVVPSADLVPAVATASPLVAAAAAEMLPLPVLRGLSVVQQVPVEGLPAEIELASAPVTVPKVLLAMPVAPPQDIAPEPSAPVVRDALPVRVVPPLLAEVVDAPRPDAGQRDDSGAVAGALQEIVLPVRRLRGDLPEVLTVLQGSTGAQRELDGRTALGEAASDVVAPVGSAVVLPGVSGGNAVVRRVSEAVPAVALPEAAPASSVESAALGPVAIGVEGGEQDLRVSLSGSSAAAATMSAEAPRLLAELAANGVRVQSLAFDGRAEFAADAGGQGGFGAGPGQQGASQSGSERGRAGIAAGLMRLPDAPARPRASERYA
jgi:hypothetical protein